MTAIDEMLQANAAYASDFTKGSLVMPPSRKLAIVACMDARIETGRAFGIEEGQAHVIRNAGGRMADALRSIAISQALLGTEELAIVHHSDCGMLTFTDEAIRQKLRGEWSAGAEADEIAFLPFSDLEASVREDIERYQASKIVRHDIPVRGFIFDVKTGALSEVHMPQQ